MQENHNEVTYKSRKDKIIDRTLIAVLIVFCIVLLIMGIDIEKKLSLLSESEPVPVTSVSESVYYSETTTMHQNVSSVPYSETTTILQSEALTSEQASGLQSEKTEYVPLSETTQITTTVQSAPPTVTASASETQPSTQTLTTVPPTAVSESFPSVIVQHPTTNSAHTAQNDGKYYITASGTKYHVSTCSHLKKTKIEIELNDAVSKGYEPCSRCIK